MRTDFDGYWLIAIVKISKLKNAFQNKCYVFDRNAGKNTKKQDFPDNEPIYTLWKY